MANNEARRTKVDDAQASKLTVSKRKILKKTYIVILIIIFKLFMLFLLLRIYDVPSNYKVQ